MSGLTSFALALTAARALRNRTWAQTRVYIEPTTPIKIEEPTICIYVGHGRSEIETRELMSVSKMRVRFEMFLPSSVDTLTVGNHTAQFDVSKSVTAPFAIFWRQCEMALQAGDDVWANLWRAFVLRMSSMDTTSDLFENEKGARIPARFIEITLDPLNEPRVGLPPDGAWVDLLAAMRAEGPELSAVADLIETQFVGDALVSDWRADFTLLGLSPSMGAALGLALDGDIDNDPSAPAVVEVPADPDYS